MRYDSDKFIDFKLGMMQEGDHDHYFFWKKYKVNAKFDQDMFNIKYQIYNQQNFPDNVSVKSNQSRGSKHPTKNQPLIKTSSKSKFQEPEGTLKPKKSKWKEKPHHHLDPGTLTAEEKQPSSEELTIKSESEQLKLEQQTNRQISKQQLIEKRLNVHKQSLQQLEKTSSQQSQCEKRSYLIEDEYSSQSSQEDQENPTLYRQYKDLTHIEESRANKEFKYFKGRIQFSEEVKWSAKIISNEIQGILVVQGTHLNRALHEDEVYFTIVEVKKLETMCSVVGIAKRRSVSIVGKIDVSKEHNLYVCKPINKRINKLIIKEESIKQVWTQRFDSYYFLVEFVQWHHSKKYPTCRLVEEFGMMGDIEVESKALLKTHGVEYLPQTKADKKKIIESFGESFKSGEFSIPEAEKKLRKDFRRWKVFIIKDNSYDIALSVYPLKTKSPGNFLKKAIYEINVHFVDVAYFAEEGSLLDQFLKKRITSFDMIYRQLPLLPQPILSAASFEVHKQRMTISVCIQVDQEGNIIDNIKIGKAIVQPGCIFTNEQIMKIISQKQVSPEQYKSWNCGLNIYSEVSSYINDIKLIHGLMSKVRSNRIAEGAFSFDTASKSIRLDEKYSPIQYELTSKNEAYFLVHQCLIVAQQKIGEYLFKNLKEKAILYRHKFPGEKRLEKLKEVAVKIGHPILENKLGEFHCEINNLLADPKVALHLKEVIRYEILVFLQQADYFQTENFDPKAWNNYIINIPIYSHCAAPTIRYGDILVQRQLLRIISKQQWKQPDTETKELLELCNKYRQIAKKTKNQCEKILLCHFVKNNNVVTSAVVIGLERWGVKLCIPDYGFKTSIKFSKIAGLRVIKQDCDFNRCRGLKMEYKKSQDNSVIQFVIKQLSEMSVKINCTTSFPLNFYVTLIISDPKDPAKKTLII